MKPVIAELLRTCVYQVPLLLRVERSVFQENALKCRTTKSGLSRQSRLYLTDDELIIQALLLPDLGVDVQDGDVLKIHKYKVQKAKRKDHAGHIVFLSIQDFDVVARVQLTPLTVTVGDGEEGGFIREISTSTSLFTTAGPTGMHSSSQQSVTVDDAISPPLRQPQLRDPHTDNSDEGNTTFLPASQVSDDFENVTPDFTTTQKRRQALRELDLNQSPYSKPTSWKNLQAAKRTTVSSPAAVINLPVVTPLASLAGIAPSTPITVLVAITWTGQALLRPSPAFPAKRHLKLHDVSIGNLFSGVSLAVYIDAANFKPERGTVALLQDVVVQRCGSGTGNGEVNECFMLNAYANIPSKLREKGVSSHWFVDEEHELEGMGLEAEVDELRHWWAQREAKRSSLPT